MYVIGKIRYLLILISLTFVETIQENIDDSDHKYDCSYCQPEQIHIAFGGKLHLFLSFAQKQGN